MARNGSLSVRDVVSWVLLNALWTPLAFQDAALMTIAVPAALVTLAPGYHVAALAALASIAAFGAMVVPPLAGILSDRLRRKGGTRRAIVVLGLAIDVASLVSLAFAHTLLLFGVLLVLAIVGANVALAAYQALLPECVPRAQWGVVSGVRGVVTLIGTVLGLGIAGVAPDPRFTFVIAAIVVAICALSLLGVHEGEWVEPERVRVRDWHDFMVVFAARVLVFFGLILLQTFVLYYFRDVQHLSDPSAGTALAAFCTMIGAAGSSIYLGILSDRAPRKLVTAAAGVPMALAASGFAIAPDSKAIFLYALLFGIGFGGVLSSGWALAMDSIPELSDVARDLGLWGIATNLPNVVAPLIGGWLIAWFHGTRPGYQAVFALSGLSFALASLAVLRVGRKPLSSLYELPFRFAAIASNWLYLPLAYRIRGWGNLPRKRGPSLLIANHQHDLESMALVSHAYMRGPWRHPLFTACSRRMYEPGFFAVRIPWLRTFLRPVNAGALFLAIGMLPIENELSSREISGLAYTVQRKHGALPLSEIFDERVATRFAPGTTTADLYSAANFAPSRAIVKLATLREPYRREVLDETRASIGHDLAAMEDVVRRGATFYLTPEGRYSTDGTIGPMRGAVDRLMPLSTIYLAGVTYDPFAPGRFSMLYRIVRLDDREHLKETLAAIRPVTTSLLLAAWLLEGAAPLTLESAQNWMRRALGALPRELFVDPELRRNPQRCVARAFGELVRLGLLIHSGAGFALAAERRHRQFPLVDDIVAYQARFLSETVANAAYARPYASPELLQSPDS